MSGLPVLVLAAGASRRLGRPKQLEPVHGEPLVRRAVRAALAAGGPVLLVTGAQGGAVAAAVADLPVRIVANPDWAEGMAASIRAGMAALPADAPGVLLMVCDQLALDADQVRRLVSAWVARPDQPAGCGYAGVVGVPAVFPASAFPALRALAGDRGARDLLRAGPVTVLPFEAGVLDLDR